MKTIRSWMSHHPFKVILFTFLFTLIPAIMAVTNDSLFYPGLAAFIFFVIVWAIGLWRYSKNIITVTLLAGLSSYTPCRAAEQPQQNSVGIGVGVVVICVGGYCIYRVVKFCQKKFPPKSTNSEPSELWFALEDDEYGATWDYSSIGSCYDGDANQLIGDAGPYDAYVAILNCSVDGYGRVQTSIQAAQDHDGDNSQTWQQLQAELAEHGLMLSGMGTGTKHYSYNRIPCGPELVPLRFDEQTHAIVHAGFAGQMTTISIERSKDFQTWSRFMTVTTPFGSRFQVADLTRSGQMFYRVSVSQP